MLQKDRQLGEAEFGLFRHINDPINPDDAVQVIIPRRPGLLEDLFQEFEWDWEIRSHPVTTGNCRIEDHRPARTGDFIRGTRCNAAYSCRHCYPGSNPALLEWDEDQIHLTVVKWSSKPYRMLRVLEEFEENAEA